MFGTWILAEGRKDRRASRSKATRSSRRGKQRLRAINSLEWLEDRTLLSMYVVTSAADDGKAGELRWAVLQANASGIGSSNIEFELGTSSETIALTQGQLELQSSVTIYDGPGEGSVTISGNHASRVFQVDSSVTATISGLTITGGSATYGGGLDILGNATLSDCTFSGNEASGSGGAIFTQGGSLSLTDCTVASNTAAGSGGGIEAQGTVSVSSSTFSGNLANIGGAIDNYFGNYTVSLQDSILAGDTAPGGGPEFDESVISLGHNLVSDTSHSTGWISSDVTGQAADLGALGYYGGPTQTIPLLPDSPAIGAGIAVSGVTTDQRGFTRGSSVDVGAFQTQTALVVNTTIDGTGSPFGDLSLRQAVYLANVLDTTESITFSPSVFASPQTITLTAGQLELSNTGGTQTITGPAAGVIISGGGASRVFQIDPAVTATLSGLTITGGLAGSGGGVYDLGTATLTDCTLASNTAGSLGGAIFNLFGTLSLTDCTLASNSAGLAGGAIDTEESTTTVLASTFSGNSAAAAGGAIDNLSGSSSLNVEDDIFAGDSAQLGPEVSNGVTSLGHNLVSNIGYSSGWISSDLTGESADLGPLGDYGGPTPTMPLLPGSTAIGAGVIADYPDTTTPITTDQRGEPLDSPNPDIGAFQSQGFTLTAVSATAENLAPGAPVTLAVKVTANNPMEPVAGGVLTFNAGSSGGASATLTGTPATIGAAVIGGTNYTDAAVVNATANATAGTYTVEATAAGVATPVDFTLTNLIGLSFAGQGVANQTITYGTSSVTISGTLASGANAPVGADVHVTLVNGPTHSATIGAGGAFTTTFTNTASMGVAASPYTFDLTYAGDATFAPASTTVMLTVIPANPAVSWQDPGDITYGTALSSTQLDASANVDGTFSYTPAPGTVVAAGEGQTLSVTFTPEDSTDYTTATVTATINVDKAMPSINWTTPADITYGTALSSTQLDATASWTVGGAAVNVNGEFTYAKAVGTVLTAGAGQTLSVSFTPDNTTDFTTAIGSATITVDKATPTTAWANPSAINYGTALSGTQLDASASWVVGGVTTNVAGTPAYTPTPGTVLPPGEGQLLSMSFVPTDTTDYTTATASAIINVNKTAPIVTWASPADITYGTPLSTTQLNATANVAGVFQYTPVQGTYLPAGTNQTLSAVFTPTDTADYSTVTAQAMINVAKATPSLGLTDPGGTYDGNPFAASATVAGSGSDHSSAGSLQGISPTLTYYDGAGTSGTGLGSTPPSAPGTYTVVAAFPGDSDYLPVVSPPVVFTINQASANIALMSNGGSAVYGQGVTFVATVSATVGADGTPTGTVTFLDGGSPLETVPLNGSGRAMFSSLSLSPGSHSITAIYNGSAFFVGAGSAVTSESVSREATNVILVAQPVLKKKKVLSFGVNAEIKPSAPGGGVPTGTVAFELVTKKRKKIITKVLGTAGLSGGDALLTVGAKSVLGQTITIVYSGDGDFLGSTIASPKVTSKGL